MISYKLLVEVSPNLQLCAIGYKAEPSTFCCQIVKFMLRPNVVKKHFVNFECHIVKQVTDNLSNKDG